MVMGGIGDKGTTESASLSHTDVTQLWAKFRAGDTVHCPRDAHGIALAVDGAAKAYRLVCTKCGLASPWFSTSPSGVVFKTQPQTMNPNGNPAEE